ncbi:MAG: hypothetical protein KBG28_05885 [Kofleriaceae bacterium]|nr:hypothetical protein [Kofleriaceae bacterium]
MSTTRRVVLASLALLALGPICPSPVAHAAGCPVEPGLTLDHAEPSTAAAVELTLARRGLAERGATWLGRLASVGGGARDTLLFVPTTLDPDRPVELVIYHDGHGAMAPGRVDARHGAAITHLLATGRNAVYVAPDAPWSSHGRPTARGAYWQAGCDHAGACAGGHAAPGDFVAFLDAVQAHVAAAVCASPGFTLTLIGFSAGGRGVRDAVVQLATTDALTGLRQLIYADAHYATAWVDDAWRVIGGQEPWTRVTLLVSAGRYDGADGNRRRAWDFARGKVVRTLHRHQAGNLIGKQVRVVQVDASHHGIGDAAVGLSLPP